MTSIKFGTIVVLIGLLGLVSGEFRVQKKYSKEIEDNICSPKFCQDPTSTSPIVKSHCSVRNGTINQRCCLFNSQNQTLIIGIDYSNCSITQLSTTVGSLNKSRIPNVEILDVVDNPLTECGDLRTFAGFLELDELHLIHAKSNGQICNCPGGNYSWVSVTEGICIGRKPVCNTTFSLSFNQANINCTFNSECAENGPGNFVCNCKEGYHGYKCLYEGTFPSILFTSLICGVTLGFSGLLWHLERRHVKKHQH